MKKVFDRKTIDINRYLQVAGNYSEVVLIWNGSKSYNGKSIISVINALLGKEQTKIEIIADTDIATRFINDLEKINIKFE
jgi:phosphotransferase system HPr-like phosphotransfer protein